MIMELPASLVIPYEEVSYRIFISFDSVTYFICKGIGHITKQCSMQPMDSTDIRPVLPEDATSIEPVEVANKPNSQEITTHENTEKRPPSSPTTSSIDTNIEDSFLTQTSIFAPPKNALPNKHKKAKKKQFYRKHFLV